MHRLASEMFGEFFADEDVTDRLTLAEPQRLQRAGPGRPPCQLHVGEGLEQLLRAQAVAPLDCFIDRTCTLGCRIVAAVVDAAHDSAVGVQRPFGGAVTVRAAVDLETPLAVLLARALHRMQCQLHLARTLLGQDDRLVEEDIFHPRRCTNCGQRHRCVCRARDNDDAIDDVVGQPRLRLDGQPAGEDAVAGREILCAAQEPGDSRAVDFRAGDAGRLGPEAAVLERIGGQFDFATRLAVQRSEIRAEAADVGRSQRVGDLAAVPNAFT